MNIETYSIIFFITGVITFAGLRHFMPWPEKNNKFFYIIGFTGLILGMLVGIPKDFNEGILMPFFAGLLVGDFSRNYMNKAVNFIKKKSAPTKKPGPEGKNTKIKKAE